MSRDEREQTEEAPRPVSAEMRARIITDSIGSIGEGDYRKRVYDAALTQIRSAVALAISCPGFYAGTDIGR